MNIIYNKYVKLFYIINIITLPIFSLFINELMVRIRILVKNVEQFVKTIKKKKKR